MELNKCCGFIRDSTVSKCYMITELVFHVNNISIFPEDVIQGLSNYYFSPEFVPVGSLTD